MISYENIYKNIVNVTFSLPTHTVLTLVFIWDCNLINNHLHAQQSFIILNRAGHFVKTTENPTHNFDLSNPILELFTLKKV